VKVDTKNLVSMTEANQNFSKVAKLVEENGIVVILKNDTPRYVLTDYSLIDNQTYIYKRRCRRSGKDFQSFYGKECQSL
jgi:antitoxin Phd